MTPAHCSAHVDRSALFSPPLILPSDASDTADLNLCPNLRLRERVNIAWCY